MNMQAVEIKSNTRYWFVRPGISGKFYQNFYEDGCIAIGWDRIESVYDNEKLMSIDDVKNMVEEKYIDLLQKKKSTKEYKRKISEIATKIYRFTYEMKEGDIVITPGEDSILIGSVSGEVEIISDKYKNEEESTEESYIGALNKIRKVKWIKKIDKLNLEPNIKLELRVIHGLSEINNSQVITEINRTLFSYYVYKNVGHSIYKIRSQKDIDFEKYAKFISCIYDIYSEIKTDTDKLYIKANINSPGPIELFGNTKIVNKITTMMQLIFKTEIVTKESVSCDCKMVEELKEKYKGINYDDYEFPCGGQV